MYYIKCGAGMTDLTLLNKHFHHLYDTNLEVIGFYWEHFFIPIITSISNNAIKELKVKLSKYKAKLVTDVSAEKEVKKYKVLYKKYPQFYDYFDKI